uniref:uncharacterized protein LOC128931277 isoform X2 n=1 Tax=Callithrix jacchus TaxID=9483 RepID=UPI0023DD5E82|nr:uncharacterized protein LOC128931277 isoform X2 [Callithrix jacchus]
MAGVLAISKYRNDTDCLFKFMETTALAENQDEDPLEGNINLVLKWLKTKPHFLVSHSLCLLETGRFNWKIPMLTDGAMVQTYTSGGPSGIRKDEGIWRP